MAQAFLALEAFAVPFCPKGHFKPDVGVDMPSKTCSACRAERRRNNKRIFPEVESMSRPFCPKGHFKPDVGVRAATQECYQCHRERVRRADSRRTRERAKGRPPLYQEVTNMRGVRELLDLTRPQFAKAIGVSPSSVYDWEAGVKKMRVDTAERVIPTVARLLRERNERIRSEQGLPSRGRNGLAA